MAIGAGQDPQRDSTADRVVRSNRSHDVHVGGTCELRCPLCDCRASEGGGIERALDEGGARLVLRGTPVGQSALPEIVRRARERGFSDIVVRTNGLRTQAEPDARKLAEAGIDGALVPLFSAVSKVHDRIAGRPDALAQALVGMRALSAAGIAMEIEVPLLSRRLQDPEAIVALAHRAVPVLRRARFFISSEPVPPALAPPDLREAGPALAGAIRRCRDLGVQVQLSAKDEIPLCTLRDAPDVQNAHHFNPRGKARRARGAVFGEECGRCAARRQCPGLPAVYHAAHGEQGVVAYERRPRQLYDQRTEGSPVFTPEHRRAAARATMVVLRPTVNCNQDCTFCSANETSGNVWVDTDSMMRAISRAARRGVERISFGGGEPTLSRDLVHYVSAAHRLGVGKIEVVTNGVLLDKETRVRALREAGLTDAFVSLHAHEERISQLLTRKVGDHEKTVRAIHHLLDAGVRTAVNHVIMSRNYPYLSRFVEFVRKEFDGRIMISFAFVTPQFKALEDVSQVPRLSDVIPHLRRALYRGIEIGQETSVGSRQGIPPCFLGEFRGWSDVLDLAPEAASEDAPQKQRGSKCDECRYTRQCTGLWRPYVERYGTSELVPVPGTPFSDDELKAIAETPRPTRLGGFSTFEGLHELLRDRDAEAAGHAEYQRHRGEAAPPLRSLPVFVPTRSRPIRVAIAGSGRQARRLARAAAEVPGLSIDAVASPHAPDAPRPEFGGCPTYRVLDDVIEEIRPEAAIIAAATPAHLALAKRALAAGVPILLEKPPVRDEAEARELTDLAAEHPDVPLLVAHNMVFSPGVGDVLGASGGSHLSVLRRVTPSSPEALAAWSRDALYQSLYHLLSLVVDAAAGDLHLETVTFRGDVRPVRVRIELSHDGGSAEVTLAFDATSDEVLVSRSAAPTESPQVSWHRSGSRAILREGDRERGVQGNDVVQMLAHFRDVVLGNAPLRVPLSSGIAVMRAARAVIAALEQAGAPFDRKEGPRHVASPAMMSFPRHRKKAAP